MSEVAHLEPWLGVARACEYLDCGETWLKERLREGMPHTILAGRVKVRPSQIEPWLEEHGFLERRGDDG